MQAPVSLHGVLIRVVLCLLVCHRAWGLDCLSCVNVKNISECHTTETCHDTEQCYTTYYDDTLYNKFSLGCRPVAECPRDLIIGRDVGSGVVRKMLSPGDAPTASCDQCCHTDFCNRYLCESFGGSNNTCSDNPSYNCQLIAATFNVCQDIQHAKAVCRKWCGLCDLVDGVWSQWGEWSMCQRTCGESQRIRLRKCDSPAPSGGGLDCSGLATDFKNCSGVICPVHGGWSVWQAWGSCSVTCDVGLQKRTRTCSNPFPSHGGDHCFGDQAQYDVCYSKACSDGKWSVWMAWSACTASCDGGLQSRTRTCTNPPPSVLGRTCTGNNIEYVSCQTQDCVTSKPPTDNRNSTTSGGGNTGTGTSMGGGADVIFFTVNSPTGHLFPEHVPEFSNIVINEGNGYDQSTGKFTSKLPGIYEFSVVFITSNSTSQCLIRQNRNILVYAITHADHGWKAASASTYVHCDVGDVIDLSCGEWQYVDHNASSMFSGGLVHAD